MRTSLSFCALLAAGAAGCGDDGGRSGAVRPKLITSAPGAYWQTGSWTEVTSGTADLTVDDAATLALHANCTSGTEPAPAYITGSSYKPNSPLAAFAGQDLSGSWSLKAVDSAGQDTGTIVRWCLLPDVAPPQPDQIFKDGFEAPAR